MAEHPWTDTRTLVSRLVPSWRASFPRALAIRIDGKHLTKHRLSQLADLRHLIIDGRSWNSFDVLNELTLAAARVIPGLEALHHHVAVHRWYSAVPDVLQDDSVWGCFGALRELTVEVDHAVLSPPVVGGLCALRKLAVTFVGERGSEVPLPFLLTDAGLAALLLLQAGQVSLASVPRLSTLKLVGVPLASRALEHAQRALTTLVLGGLNFDPDSEVLSSVRCQLLNLCLLDCTGLSSELLMAPALSTLLTLTLRDVSVNAASAPFAGLESLETLDVTSELATEAVDSAFVRGGLAACRALRCLRWNSRVTSAETTRSLLSAVRGCPLAELSLSGKAKTAATAEDLAILPTSLVTLNLPCLLVRNKSLDKPWARIANVVVRHVALCARVVESLRALRP